MDSSKIFIIGANGQLGLALQAQYPQAGTADINKLDITDIESVRAFDWSNYTTVINAAAYTNVDGAQTPEGRTAAWKVNATAVANLAAIMNEENMTFVHVSTDYVFDGTHEPHSENEDLSPLSVYGQSKAAGDIAVGLIAKHYLLRTSWVIGEGKNFVRTMLGLADRGISPSVVSDQVGRLTFTSELVRAIDHLLANQSAYGTYNVSNNGDPTSWADITRTIFEMAGKTELTVTDTSTAEYYAGKEGIAPRPLKSTLDLTKLGATGFKSTDWKEALEEYIQKEIA